MLFFPCSAKLSVCRGKTTSSTFSFFRLSWPLILRFFVYSLYVHPYLKSFASHVQPKECSHLNFGNISLSLSCVVPPPSSFLPSPLTTSLSPLCFRSLFLRLFHLLCSSPLFSPHYLRVLPPFLQLSRYSFLLPPLFLSPSPIHPSCSSCSPLSHLLLRSPSVPLSSSPLLSVPSPPSYLPRPPTPTDLPLPILRPCTPWKKITLKRRRDISQLLPFVILQSRRRQ